jgi:hypothetical protein
MQVNSSTNIELKPEESEQEIKRLRIGGRLRRATI